MKEQKKSERAITLIALIISIIVLLILAGVSLTALLGDNGILNQATNAAEKTEIASEEEMLSQIVVSENADKIQHPKLESSYHIGIDLYDKTLENGDIWNIVVINETQEDYGTGWTYIEKGTNLMDYGESKYSWLVNYNTGEKVRLEEGTYTRLDYSSSMAVTDGLIFNIDPTILEGVTTEELQNNPDILGENVELKNFNWTEESGLTSTSFNFDGEDDHINILYEDQEKLNALYENGLTFEYYGTIEEGAHVDYEGNIVSDTFTRSNGFVESGMKLSKQNLDSGMQPKKMFLSVVTSNRNYISPYSDISNPWNVAYPADIRDGELHYWVWSIDCTAIYNSLDTSELDGYEGDFYSSKVFVDGELVYDTYYSKAQYDYLKNNQEGWYLKYFTVGRCSMSYNGWWHYAKMHTYCMRLYNRGLSEEEIIENYNTTKAYYSAVIGD